MEDMPDLQLRACTAAQCLCNLTLLLLWCSLFGMPAALGRCSAWEASMQLIHGAHLVNHTI